MLNPRVTYCKQWRILDFKLPGDHHWCAGVFVAILSSHWGCDIGRGAISLCLLMLLLFVDDHIPCVVADVDDTTEVAIGVVVRVAGTLYMTFCYTLAPQSPLLICGSCYAHRGPEPPPLARLPI